MDVHEQISKSLIIGRKKAAIKFTESEKGIKEFCDPFRDSPERPVVNSELTQNFVKSAPRGSKLRRKVYRLPSQLLQRREMLPSMIAQKITSTPFV